MDGTNQHQAHKRGANRKELARKEPKRDRNYSQSRDVWEDRCTRQHKILNSIPRPPRNHALPRDKDTIRIDGFQEAVIWRHAQLVGRWATRCRP